MKNKTWSPRIFFGLLILPLLTTNVYAKTFALACPDIASCAQSVSALTGDQYIFVDEPKCGKLHGTTDSELTAENANLIFSNVLALCEYTRVPIDAKSYSIRRNNEARGMAIPRYHASETANPNFPDTADLATLLYHASHPEAVRRMAEVVRSSADSNAKVVYDIDAGLLMLTDRTDNLKSLLTLFRQTDVKKGAETLQQEKNNLLFMRSQSTCARK